MPLEHAPVEGSHWSDFNIFISWVSNVLLWNMSLMAKFNFTGRTCNKGKRHLLTLTLWNTVVHVHVWILNKNYHNEIFRQLVAIFTFPLHLSSYLPDPPFSSSVSHCHLLLRVTRVWWWQPVGKLSRMLGWKYYVGWPVRSSNHAEHRGAEWRKQSICG